MTQNNDLNYAQLAIAQAEAMGFVHTADAFRQVLQQMQSYLSAELQRYEDEYEVHAA